jgi:hypothetical protein
VTLSGAVSVGDSGVEAGMGRDWDVAMTSSDSELAVLIGRAVTVIDEAVILGVCSHNEFGPASVGALGERWSNEFAGGAELSKCLDALFDAGCEVGALTLMMAYHFWFAAPGDKVHEYNSPATFAGVVQTVMLLGWQAWELIEALAFDRFAAGAGFDPSNESLFESVGLAEILVGECL